MDFIVNEILVSMCFSLQWRGRFMTSGHQTTPARCDQSTGETFEKSAKMGHNGKINIAKFACNNPLFNRNFQNQKTEFG